MCAKKILIIDDNLVILKTLGGKLENSGFTVVTAQDGGEAIRLARQERPHVILIDLGFPPDVAHGGGVPWDGFLIMGWLRRTEQAKNTPFIVVTGSPPDTFRQRALAMGAVAVFNKPVDTDKLVAAIRDILAQEAARQIEVG